MYKRYARLLTYVACCAVIVGLGSPAQGDDTPKSLFSYNGYISSPSARVTDHELGYHFTFLPYPYSFNQSSAHPSDNLIFSPVLGLFPFLELYFSLFVEKQYDVSHQIPGFGRNKFRSFGAKLKLVNESGYRPAVAIGIFDPDVTKLGAKKTANNVSSSVIIATKKFDAIRTEVSVGYGFDILSGIHARLQGFFGGGRFRLYRSFFYVADYDAKNLYHGVGGRVWNFDALVALTEKGTLTYRIGYCHDLLK